MIKPLRCDFFGAVLVVATCLFSVAFSQDLGAANVGLAISNSIQVRSGLLASTAAGSEAETSRHTP
jgi:hypothetical protein